MRIVVLGQASSDAATVSTPDATIGLQVGKDVVGRVPITASSGEWIADVAVLERDGRLDFRGPAIHGKRGERFLYLVWDRVDGDAFAMIGRSKLMLDTLPAELAALDSVVVTVTLTDAVGRPRFARLPECAVAWSTL